MTELFLIAHKVRGEPAFDVASRMECPICETQWREGLDNTLDCIECDSTGFWWIIPTSGHRAYPYYDVPLANLLDSESEAKVLGDVTSYAPPMPPNLPDHYPTRTAASTAPSGLAALLAKRKSLNVERRGR